MTVICGIQGDGARSAEAMDAMLAALADYGSERAAWTEGEIIFGRRSAPVTKPAFRIDREAGLAVIADARLDDRDSLCGALGIPLSERAEPTDVDLILRAWKRWGRKCPDRLLGDYAFAVWDARRRRLVCVRDPVGVRPFYYSLTGERFVFASAVEAVLAAFGVSAALDEVAVAAELIGSPHSAGRTFFAAVRRLPPSHMLTVEAEAARNGSGRLRVRIERWWHPGQVSPARSASDDAHAEELLHLCTQAVRDRLCGGPVGMHLSGGLDSSSIMVLAARELRRQGRPPPPVFTWLPPTGDAPPKPEYAQEYALVDAVCAREGVRAFYGVPSPEEILEVLRRDGTLPGVQVHVNEEIVQRRAAAQGVRVLLSGWGGDECVSFNGRGYWEHLLLNGRLRRLAAECRDQDSAAPRFLAHIVASLLHPALPYAFRRWLRGKPIRRRGLAAPAFARRAAPPVAWLSRAAGVRGTQLHGLQAGHLDARIEGWAASGARRGIEYRYPLLDRRLLEFALGLPPEQFRRGRWKRWLFRYALRAVLPPEVCWNQNKADPARSEPTHDAIVEILPVIRRLLAAHTPSRARYIDMPRLWGQLGADHFRKIPEPGLFMRALYFLDF